MSFVSNTLNSGSVQGWAKGASFSKAALVAALGGLFAVPSLADGVSATPIATVNSFATATQCSTPYAVPWHGTFTPNGNGGLLAFNPAYSTTSLMINNVNKLDFSQAGALALDVTNPTGQEADFLMIIHDSGAGVIQNIFAIPANSTKKIALLLCPAGTASSYGLQCLPAPYQGFQCYPGFNGESANLKSINNVMFVPAGASPANQIILSNMRLMPSFSWNGLMTASVDAFGQSAVTTWSGKLTDSSQFATRRAAEESSFTNFLGSQVDSYGGSLALPAQKATGHFRTQLVNGKWWLVDPLGNLFFMNGVDEVRSAAPVTTVSGRTPMFASLPASTDPLAANYTTTSGGTGYNFYTANLQRKYGPNWEQNWVNTAVSRFKSWGINALGTFAGDDMIASHQLPYIYKTDVSGSFNTVSTGSDLWGPMPDPFDPVFQTATNQMAASAGKQANNDPNMIGIIVGNELSWSGSAGTANDPFALALGTLGQTAPKSPAKTAFLKVLTAEYGTIAALNTAWGTKYASWTAMNAPLTFGLNLSTSMQKDLTRWVASYAYQYYEVVKKALKQVAPNTLYFGNSYSTTHMPEQVLWEASYHVDAYAFNMYGSGIDPKVTANMWGIQLPILVTEFNFTSTTDGLWGGYIPVPDENSRASAYQNYMGQLLNSSQYIGGCYYMYSDEATSGGANGQNNVQGLVDVTDTPYPSMVAAVRSVASAMYSTSRNANSKK